MTKSESLLSDMNSDSKEKPDAQRAIQGLNGEKRAFESEAESSILKIISSSSEQSEVDSHNNDFARTRANARATMAKRATLVSKLPMVIEDESLKSLGMNSDSSLNVSTAPKLRDIAQRIRIIQQVSQSRKNPVEERRRSTASNHSTGKTDIENQRLKHQSYRNGFVSRLNILNDDDEKGDRDVETAASGKESEFDIDEDEKLVKGKSKSLYHQFWSLWNKFTSFIQSKKKSVGYCVKVVAYGMMPLLAVSGILFYFAGNPIGPLGASYSWWFLYFIRHGVTLMQAHLSHFLLIDFIALETKLMVVIFGRVFTLIAMQARGWPTLLLFWSIYNFALLYGDNAYVKHWLFKQSSLGIFNASNPAGSVTTNPWYRSYLIASIASSVLIVFKRVLVAMLLGKKKYATYGPKMEQIMRRVLIISEIALLAEEIEDAALCNMRSVHHIRTPASGWLFRNMQSHLKLESVEEETDVAIKTNENGAKNHGNIRSDSGFAPDDPAKRRSRWIKALTKASTKKRVNRFVDSATKIEIEKLLEWDEPIASKKVTWNDNSIRMILQFKETLNYMDGKYPLSVPFGLADTQKHCLESSQKVFERLILKTPEFDVLKFETLLTIAFNEDGTFDKSKAKFLKRLFCPRSNGDIEMLDFIKTCNDVYKRIRLFRAKTLNSAQLDDAFEQLIDIVFYFLLALLALSIQGVDPFDVFISMTGILVPLAFLFNDAGSQYFQGLLLILARKPYDIGDCIAISDPTNDTDINGSVTWFVENITLFTTTLRSVPSNEVATISNGALASTRIINAARSQRAQVFVFLKLSIDIPYEKVKIFHSVVEEFIKDRPREWIQMCAFRAKRVEADLGFIEYELLVQHIEAWQMIGQVLKSKADLSSFCLEVMKQMGMRYVSPSMPVNVTLQQSEEDADEGAMNEKYFGEEDEDDELSGLKALSTLFQPLPTPPPVRPKFEERH